MPDSTVRKSVMGIAADFQAWLKTQQTQKKKKKKTPTKQMKLITQTQNTKYSSV